MAQSSNSENSSDILTIVNRSKEYKISKTLICSKIPYFDNMCSSYLKESVDGEVILDLDDKAFESLIHWVRSGTLLLDMPNVVRLCDCADYLMIDTIRDTCLNIFWNHFNIKYTWPNGLDGASGILNFLSQQLFSYLSRSFNIIKASPTFTELPFEVVHYLCQVDACVKSEREIFDAFKRWIDNKKNDTEGKLNLLMETIRWPYVSSDELTYMKEEYKSLGGNDEDFAKLSTPKSVDLEDRKVEDILIAIFSVADDQIELFYFRGKAWTSSGIYKKDDNLSLSLYSDHKLKTDIIYESGRRGIRIDWLNKKYRYLDIMGSPSPYYTQLFRHLVSFVTEKADKNWFHHLNVFFPSFFGPPGSSTAMLNYNGKYSLIDISVFYHDSSFRNLMNVNFGDLTCLATMNSRNVFVITKNEPNSFKIYTPNIRPDSGRRYIPGFIECKEGSPHATEGVEKVPISGESSELEDLDLINHEEEIYVIKKSSNEILVYQPESVDCKFMPKHIIVSNKKLITVASASIPKAFLSN